MKRKLSVIFLLLTVSFIHAQNNRCIFQATTAAYADLTGAKSLNDSLLRHDSTVHSLKDIENTVFNLYGEQWTMQRQVAEVWVKRYGRIQVMRSGNFSIIDCLYAPNFDTIDATSGISYKLDGAVGQEILKLQWKNMRIRTGPAGNYVNVQTWLYHDGTIEFRYGPRSANNASGYTNPVTAPYIGIWYSDHNFTAIYEKMNLQGVPPALTVDSGLNMNVPNVQGIPAEGMVYRFVPKTTATGIYDGTAEAQPGVYAAGNLLHITGLTGHGPAYISVTDLSGKTMSTTEIFPATHETISLPVNLAPGIYVISVSTKGKMLRTKLVLGE